VGYLASGDFAESADEVESMNEHVENAGSIPSEPRKRPVDEI
jgi:hypothetical protein